jgi:hypothetical protein
MRIRDSSIGAVSRESWHDVRSVSDEERVTGAVGIGDVHLGLPA